MNEDEVKQAFTLLGIPDEALSQYSGPEIFAQQLRADTQPESTGVLIYTSESSVNGEGSDNG